MTRPALCAKETEWKELQFAEKTICMDTSAPCGCWQRPCFAHWTLSQQHGVATSSPEQLFASEMETMACRMYREAMGSVAKNGI
jgi:hypothetical protein